ncbi:bifunctional nuclease family protein [Methanocalculus taiwanensis]|uniref:Bifunctional nuclease family protein n=1 Tax=Methanocalculus taiwanensis TaxID=106207 RepID=A0ABD4TM74_9EURY|nr:bifunctional nuclease family protein [Methanocalculus taiwanensis]MCQ1538874.1 bifunctional nuclease family protein [Methanocalculus taiwanensis]
MELITCEVAGVYLVIHDLGAAPVVLLKTPDELYIPIFIGLYEAVSIHNALDGPSPSRPMTHDLFSDALLSLGAHVREVRVDSIDDGVYYAALSLDTQSGELSIDCRPSDGIALAVRQKSPVLLDLNLMRESAVARDQLPELRDFAGYMV